MDFDVVVFYLFIYLLIVGFFFVQVYEVNNCIKLLFKNQTSV